VEIYTDPGATTSQLNLNWTSNVRPCAISYVGPGNIAGTIHGIDIGQPSGSVGDDQQVAGAYTYTLTCGTGQSMAQSSASATWFTNAPAVTLNVANPWPANSPTTIAWQSNVYPCTGSGGTAGDAWAGSKAGAMGYQAVTESATGTATFGISCGTGPQTVQSQASTNVITPVVSITANASTLPVNGTLIIHWNANVGAGCSSSISPGNGNFGTVLGLTGGFQTTQLVAGTYTYAVNCAGVQAATQVTFTGSETTLTASASSDPVGTPITLSWSSPPNSSSCTPSGGSTGDGWTGSLPGSGTKTVTGSVASTITYGISCDFGYGPSNAQAQVTYTAVSASEPATPTPTATLAASADTQSVGASVTLSWSSQNSNACNASGGESGDGWTGTLSLAGTMTVTESAAGTFSYGIVCTGAPPAATVATSVKFTTPSAVTVTAPAPKSGGGGTVDVWALLLLALLVWRPAVRAIRCSPSW
jgi:hypothetical protein